MARHNENNESKSNEVDSTTDKIQRRRLMKHMVEKRRRNRINDTLEQMRILVLKAQNKNPDNYTKMEKADIMEMTTNFLYMLNQQKSLTGRISLPIQPALQNRQMTHGYPSTEESRSLYQDYNRGYNTCQSEINNYLTKYGIQRPSAFSMTSPPMMSPVATSTPVFKSSATISRRYSLDEQQISSTTSTSKDYSNDISFNGNLQQKPTSSNVVDNLNLNILPSKAVYNKNYSNSVHKVEENNNSNNQSSSASSNDSSCWRPW